MYVNMHTIVVLMQYCTWCRVYNIVYSIYTYYKYIYTYVHEYQNNCVSTRTMYMVWCIITYAHNIYML